jgi:2-polyprenyl-3-methyl-5-hydroxy-6-metoxy-1,4-benzoquinol methylase
MVKRLTQRERWDRFYAEKQPCNPKSKFNNRPRRYSRQYSDHLWDVVFEKYVPTAEGAKVLEIGSAPGDFLVRLHERYGFIPYGVEYSEPGVALNRRLFSLYNIDPHNVIHADFFKEEFHQQFKGYFDIVISRGFIEHFVNVEDVIEKHLNVITEGGHLIVSIPNLNPRSFYGMVSSCFHKKRLEEHNLKIMSAEAFARVFNGKNLVCLHCDYLGTLRLNMLSFGDSFLGRAILSGFCRLQRILNPILRFLFRDKGMESKLFSPMLLYIGVKRGG